MKKYLFILMVSVFAGYNVYESQKSAGILTTLILDNIDALANGEDWGTGTLKCYTTITSSGGQMTHYTYCGTCSAILAYSASGTSHCMPK